MTGSGQTAIMVRQQARDVRKTGIGDADQCRATTLRMSSLPRGEPGACEQVARAGDPCRVREDGAPERLRYQSARPL